MNETPGGKDLAQGNPIANAVTRASREWQPPAWFHVAGLVAAIAAIGITVFFSIRAEHNKAITIRYSDQRPLLSREGRAGNELAVTLAGQRLAAPWLLSGTLENTGNEPIEQRDIEAPLQLTFSKGAVVGAEVSGKSQPAIAVKIAHDRSIVTIEHALLNPGDWISFDLIFDGEPGRPVASLRISGVANAVQVFNFTGEKQRHPLAFAFPPPIMYLVLVSASLAGLALIAVGIIGTLEMTKSNPADRGGAMVGVFVIVSGLMMILVLGGTWRTVLGP